MGKITPNREEAPSTGDNVALYGVKYPNAIAEAIIKVKSIDKGIIRNIEGIIIKVDSGASVSLAHPQYLTGITNCKTYDMAPVRLNGIGGKTDIMDEVGILNIIRSNSTTLKIKCYAFAPTIGRTKRLCLLSNWAIDHYKIDQPYHAHTSLRIGPQPLRFLSDKRPDFYHQKKILYTKPHSRAPAPPHPAPEAPPGLSATKAKKRKALHKWTQGLPLLTAQAHMNRFDNEAVLELARRQSLPQMDAEFQHEDPIELARNLACEFPEPGILAFESDECNCDMRYAKSIVEETYDRIEDGTLRTVEPQNRQSPVLLAHTDTEYTDQQLMILEPGIIRVDRPLVLMSEIQLKAIQDRLGKLDSNQKTDGAEMMTKDGHTYSKFSYRAMELGADVSPALKSKIDNIFNSNMGDDAVFPTKNGAPKILTKFLKKPYSYELLPEYENGSKSLPSAKAQNWTGKEASSNIIRDFVNNTPIVEPCPYPRCVSRLVIVPKFAPGQSKTDPDHGFRVTVNALMNKCLKPCASTIPLATGEILKLHHCKYYLQCDGLNAFWAIPVCDESKRLTAFHTPDGIYCFNRLLMGAKPSSAVQQSAYLEALDKYIDIDENGKTRVDAQGNPRRFRDRFALYCDDIACGSNSLDELHEMFAALISCFKRAGIQVKASKVKFGIQEVTFHNYTITAQGTKPKEANLCPIRNMGIPTDVHQVKAFLGCCQQMSQYVEKYSIIAAPMHELTRKGVNFPKPWTTGAPYDTSFHQLKKAMLDGSNYSWNKDPAKRLFLEVDASDVGWGCCAFQFATPYLTEDEGQERLEDKSKRRVIEWISKAWTTDQLKLPVFYRESLARLLCLEKFRNLIETNINAGITLYTDHMPSLYAESLSNKGQLSEWRIAEVADLNSIVQTLHQQGTKMALADPLSRLCSPSGGLYDRALPRKLAILLQHLPDHVKDAKNMRVHTNKDTAEARRIVQKWRNPTNPISPAQLTSATKSDFIIGTPYADRGTLKISQLLKENRAFACLHPTSLINEIPVENSGVNAEITEKLRLTQKIVLSDFNLTWIINLPNDKNLEDMVLFIEPTFDQHQLLAKSTKTIPEDLHNAKHVEQANIGCGSTEAHTVIDAALKSLRSKTKIHHETNLERQQLFAQIFCPETSSVTTAAVLIGLRSGNNTGPSPTVPPILPAPTVTAAHERATSNEDTDPQGASARTLRSGAVISTAAPDPYTDTPTAYVAPTNVAPTVNTIVPPFSAWIGKQLRDQHFSEKALQHIKEGWRGYPKKLKMLHIIPRRPRIVVPLVYQKALVQATHAEILHLGFPKVIKVLAQLYYWPSMDKDIEKYVRECVQCLESTVRRKHLKSIFDPRSLTKMHYPRHSYGIDFYGVANGEILSAVDLCTREVTFWWLRDRKQERVACALISGLIFVRGVPMTLRSDNAPELMQGVVRDVNSYLNIQQITTGGHNPRGNAICERVNQMIGGMLRKCTDAQYANIKAYLPAMAFAINTTNSSTLNSTPFEAGHGLPARTVATARADAARLQFNLERGTGDNTLEDISSHFDSSLHKVMLELSTRLADAANAESEWHRRMTSEKLNMTGRQIAKDLLALGAKVYFYKPPTQQETIRRSRMAKHCQHYHGPAAVVKKIGTQSYSIHYKGQHFERDQGMLIPAEHMAHYIANGPPHQKDPIPKKHRSGHPPAEGEFVLMRGGANDKDWYCCQILEVLTDRIKVSWYTTSTEPPTDYKRTSKPYRIGILTKTNFHKTWVKSPSGLPTIIAPLPGQRATKLYTGRIPNSELDQHFLIRDVSISPDGILSTATIKLAASLPIPHRKGAGGDDNFVYIPQ